ncbi:MAG: ABC transporter ATP-binding protein [Planctomycetales bacterium]|nr:ABC transporter ATP-binding protein [Planctomycetales bacterium]
MIADPLIPDRPAATAALPAVAALGVAKAYRRGAAVTPVLDGVELTIPRGQCAFLLGPSGSGKTTLLSMIGGLLKPDAGKLSVLGSDLTRLTPDAAAEFRRTRLGFIFQRFHLLQGLTASENVGAPLILSGVQPSQARQRAEELLDLVGLGDFRRQIPRRLSVGQCQRVALARALANDPELILADEPTASLDAEAGQQAMQLLRRVTVEMGRTAVVVTHDARILPFADSILAVERGRVVAQPTPTARPLSP